MRHFKRFLSVEDRHVIEAAVRETKARTAEEIVPVVVARSSRYDWVGYRAALVGWLAASVVALWFYFFRPFMFDLWEFEALQLAGMVAGWGLSRFPMGMRLLVSEHAMAEEVLHAAHSAFLRHGLASGKEHKGVLLYVSLRERRVQILADEGVHEKMNHESWKAESDRVVEGIRQGNLGGGVAAAVRSIGEKLAAHGV